MVVGEGHYRVSLTNLQFSRKKGSPLQACISKGRRSRLGLCEKRPLGGARGKAERYAECAGREALCGKAGERDGGSSEAATRRGPPDPVETQRGSGALRQMSLMPPPTPNKLNKAAAPSGPSGRPVISWGDMRPSRHCSWFPAWLPLPDQRLGQCVRSAWRRSQSWSLLFTGQVSQLWLQRSVFCPPGAWPQRRTNRQRLRFPQDAAEVDPGGPDVARSPADTSTLWVPTLAQQHLSFLRREAHEINVFLLSFPGSSLKGQENCESWDSRLSSFPLSMNLPAC